MSLSNNRNNDSPGIFQLHNSKEKFNKPATMSEFNILLLVVNGVNRKKNSANI